jgi:hypothetical protein
MAEIGWTLPGSITERHTRCSNPTCRCRAEPPQQHGPYATWTRKVDNTTVTRNLTAEQVERYRPWLANARRLRELQGTKTLAQWTSQKSRGLASPSSK